MRKVYYNNIIIFKIQIIKEQKMQTSSTAITASAGTTKPMVITNQMNNIIKQLAQTNQAYINIFNNYETKSDIVSRKHAAQLYNKMCLFLEQGSSAEARNEKKQQLCKVFRNFVGQFVQVYMLEALNRCCDDRQLLYCLIDRWENFKKFCYLYWFLLKTADTHFQTSFKAYKNQGKSNRIQNEDSIFPVAAIAIYVFQRKVFSRFKTQIVRNIRNMCSQERQHKIIQRQMLRSLLQIVYCAGLGELARINSTKIDNNQHSFNFYCISSGQFHDHYSNINKNPDANFFKNILNDLIEDASEYYSHMFNQKIIMLSPHEDFSTVLSILQKQEQVSQYYFFNHLQKNAYLNKIKQIVVVTNLQERLNKQNSLRYCLQKFDHNYEQHLSQIKLFIHTILKAKQQSLKILQKVIKQHILETGTKINEKLTKKRQHIMEMVNLKKSMNKIIEQVMNRELSICIIRDKSFKKNLDSIQASKNLADFIDFKVKQCIKNKIGDSQFHDKLKDIFLILENLVATDSFLAYHQQYLGRRLLQPLNEPKLDIQKYILRKIGEQLGTVTTSAHNYMIKDIQKSQQIAQDISKKMPLARFKFSCRIISPQFWSQNINNNSIEMILPQAIRIQAQTIKHHYFQQFAKHLVYKIQKGFSLFEGNFRQAKFRFQAENIFAMLLFHISQARNHQIHFWELMKKITKHKDGQIYINKCVKALVDNGLVIRTNPTQNMIQDIQILVINQNYKPPVGQKPNQTIMIKASAEMQKAMHESNVEQAKILKEREKVIEAVIVKILKHSHSTGSNRTSLDEIVKGVREYQYLKNFQIPESVIKQRMEEVIARGYAQRDEKDRKIYQYIA